MQSLNTGFGKKGRSNRILQKGGRFFLLSAGLCLSLLFGQHQSAHADGFTITGDMDSTRRSHTATLLDSGSVLITGGVDPFSQTPLIGAQLYNPGTEAFTATGNMASARGLHTETKLAGGKVLIAGGKGVSATLSSAELYNPATGTFSSTAGNMAGFGRQSHTATLLKNGKVLLTGGRTGETKSSTLNTAEIYDPTTGLFTATANMNEFRAFHTATLLVDGRVLITGGVTKSDATNSAEIFDPVTGQFTPTGNMASTRTYHAAALLTDGSVLITGGAVALISGASLNTAELFYPEGAGSFSSAGTMSSPHSRHTATLLINGNVLIAGSENFNGTSNTYTDVADVYVPGVGFYAEQAMSGTRASHTATLLNNGQVLITGGITATTTAELYTTIVAATTASPTSHSFPNTIVSNTSTAQDFTITNDAELDLFLGPITITGPNIDQFQLIVSCGEILLPQESCTVSVTFTPTSTGLKTAALNFEDLLQQSRLRSIPLNGTGFANTQPVPADGDLDLLGGVTILDALLALQISVNLHTATDLEMEHGDVTPFVGGVPVGDNIIDVTDALLILQKVVGLITW